MTSTEILEKKSIRPTPNRILTIKALERSQAPLSLPELEELVDTMDRSSLFRTLKLFASCGLIHTIEDGKGVQKYEICRSDGQCSPNDMHAHFYCEKCGHTFCFSDIEAPILKFPTGFHINAVNYLAKGLCPSCSKNLNDELHK